jgi:hypothetical protein
LFEGTRQIGRNVLALARPLDQNGNIVGLALE